MGRFPQHKHGKWKRGAAHCPRSHEELKQLARQVASSSSDGSIEEGVFDKLFSQRFSQPQTQPNGAIPTDADKHHFEHRLAKIEDPLIDETNPLDPCEIGALAEPSLYYEPQGDFLTDPNVFPDRSMLAVDPDETATQRQQFHEDFRYELPIRPLVEQRLNQERNYAYEGQEGQFKKPKRRPSRIFELGGPVVFEDNECKE